MATNKKSFIAYCDWLETFEELEDEEAGRLVKHLFRYVNDLDPQTEDKLTKMMFIPIKQTLKRDLKKHEAVAEKNRINGLKGGRPKKPTGLSGLNKKPKKADNDNDNDNDNDIKEKPLTPKGESFDFNKYLLNLNRLFNRNFQLVNEGTKKKMKETLKIYTKHNVWIAMQNCKNDPHHIESNYKYCTPEFFARITTIERHGDKLREKMIGSTTEYYQHD
jgi:hypothetical protein